MATQNISGKIQFRRDTAANWTSKNPTLLAGELGYETDTHKGKVGDGSTAWKNLPYVWKTTVATGSTNGTIAVDGTDVAVKGLGSAAYTASTAYAAASHNHDGRYIYWGGTASNNSAWSWGTLTVANGYTQHSHLTGSSGCEGGFASKGGQLNMQLDGYFYQNEGRYRCLDTSDSSSFAPASHSHSYLPLSGGTLTGDVLFSDSGTGTRQVKFQVGANDYARVAAGATASNAGFMEIATADDANEPIYVRQYSGNFATISRTLTLLDASGNTSIPGALNVAGAIKQNGTAVSLSGHTHNYAGSSSAGGAATSASKLNTNDGSATQPVYFSNGVPVATTYALNATVPSGAKFTDTTYTGANGISLSGTTFSNSGVRSVATGSANGTISVNTNGTAANVAVKGLGSAAYTASTAYAPASHNQASNTINAMTGYSKPSTTSAITASDSLNTAIGKLEKALEPDVSLSINDPGGSSVWIEVPVEHLIVGSTTPTDKNAIWIEIIS